jgi:hypothetical protein
MISRCDRRVDFDRINAAALPLLPALAAGGSAADTSKATSSWRAILAAMLCYVGLSACLPEAPADD